MRRSRTRGRVGDHLVVDDRTGFTVWASDTRREWNGALVRKQSWEARHPQDLVRGVPDRMRAEPTRPALAPDDQPGYGPYHTYLIADAIAGDASITVNNIVGFSIGDLIRIYLDNGDVFQTRVESVNITIDNLSITIDSISVTIDSTATLIMDPLPWPASIGNQVWNMSNRTSPTLS